MYSMLMWTRIFLLVLMGRSFVNPGDHVPAISMASAEFAGFTSAGRSKIRLLRGGSYSRGGSSYHSGGSSGWSSSSSNRNSNHSHNGNNYNNHSSNGRGMSSVGRFFTGLAIAGVCLLALGMIFGTGTIGALCVPFLCCCGAVGAAAGVAGAAAASSSGSQGNHYVNECSNDQNYRWGSNSNQFQNRVQQTKGEVESMSYTTHQQNHDSIQPFSGQYTTSFVDPESGKHHNASISIFFTPDPRGNGYRINGQGSDIDGNTVIEDGFANYDGSAWWIERNITGDLTLEVLSRGTFNFHQHKFEGTWLANTMLGGPYLSFAANQMFNSYQSQSKIPVVVATPVPTAPHMK